MDIDSSRYVSERPEERTVIMVSRTAGPLQVRARSSAPGVPFCVGFSVVRPMRMRGAHEAMRVLAALVFQELVCFRVWSWSEDREASVSLCVCVCVGGGVWVCVGGMAQRVHLRRRT